MRTFHPSHTDLSYILVAHESTLHVVIKDANGQIVPSVQRIDDSIKDPESDAQTPDVIVDQIAKPVGQKYTVEVSQTTPFPYHLQIFAYDKLANPTQFDDSSFVGPDPRSIIVDFKPDGPSSIYPKMDFTRFRKDLRIMRDTKDISTGFTYLLFDRLAGYAEKSPVTLQTRYIKQLQYSLDKYHQYLTKTGYDFLQKELSLFPAVS